MKPVKIWLVDDNAINSTKTFSHDSQDYCVILDGKRLSDSTQSNDFPNSSRGLHHGALREGQPLDIVSWEGVGLLSQYAGVGFMIGFFEVLAYPIFQNYLHMEGYQIASYTGLLSLSWSFKIFFGLLSDCVHVGGYHRRPYMIFGWSLCAIGCVLMAITPFPAAYYTSRRLFNMPRLEYTEEDMKLLTLDAPQSGGFFILLCLLSSLGYVMANVSADAMVVQYAQREPVAIRGRVQTAVFITRDAFSVLPMFLVGFCMNDYKYGGEFDWSMSPNIVVAIVSIPPIIAAMFAYLFINEAPSVPISFTQMCTKLWDVLQQRIVWQICAFMFFNSICLSYSSTMKSPVAFLLVTLEPLPNTMFLIVAQILRLLAMYIIGRYALNWNWRWTIAICSLAIVVLDTGIHLSVTWNVSRDQYVYCMIMALQAIPSSMIYLFCNYLIVEVADVGSESLIFALVTSFASLGLPVSTVLAKTLDSFLDANLDSIEDDSISTRWQITYSFIASGGVKMCSLLFLSLLPSQKAYIHLLKRIGSTSRRIPIALVLLFVVGVLISLGSHILSILNGTSCLQVAGGKGC